MAFAVVTPVFVVFLMVFINLQQYSVLSAPQVPCLFIFGDSLVDNGNNNQLNTEAKANYLPYGIDYPQGPTGRFTNGRNTADFLAQLLGFDNYIPPFAMVKDEEIIRGVNYASGSAGIRNETGQQLGDNISLDKQLQNHNLTFSQIAHFLGHNASAKEHLGKCLYYFVTGSNDYLNNYYVPEYYPTSSLFTTEEYATALVQQYSRQLMTLYNMGAKKVAVSGLGALGCIPQESSKGTNGYACDDSINDAVELFNDKLDDLVDDLNDNLTDAKFIYLEAMDLEPVDLFALGLSVLRKPCCKVSNKTGQCIAGLSPCPVRALHVFYDNFHPTEIVNKVVATTVYADMLKLIH